MPEKDKKCVIVKRSSAGLGLFADERIKKGDFVIEYTGNRLSGDKALHATGKYLFQLDDDTLVDGKGRDNLARYINHSCRPNCEVDILDEHILISSIKNIKAGDEITYNYGKEYFDEYIKPHGCRCAHCQKKKSK